MYISHIENLFDKLDSIFGKHFANLDDILDNIFDLCKNIMDDNGLSKDWKTNVFDDIALRLRDFAIRYNNDKKDYIRALKIANTALAIAYSKECRDKCAEDIDVLNKNYKIEQENKYNEFADLGFIGILLYVVIKIFKALFMLCVNCVKSFYNKLNTKFQNNKVNRHNCPSNNRLNHPKQKDSNNFKIKIFFLTILSVILLIITFLCITAVQDSKRNKEIDRIKKIAYSYLVDGDMENFRGAISKLQQYGINDVTVTNTILQIVIEKTDLSEEFFESIEATWSNELSDKLFKIIDSEKISIDIKYKIINVLAKQKYEPLKKYLINKLDKLKNNIDNNNFQEFAKLLKILLYEFDNSLWKKYKKIIYINNQYCNNIILIIASNYRYDIKDSLYTILTDDDLVDLYNKLCKLYPNYVYMEYPTGKVFTPNETKDLVTSIHNYFINTGNLKAFQQIKNSFLKKSSNKKAVYKKTCQNTLINKIKMINLDIDYLRKLESKCFSNNKIIKFINNFQFGKNNFIGNNNEVYEGDKNANR